MKVFISHSSKDTWIAHRIEEGLKNVGVTTFLDAKDLRTGDYIDDTLRHELDDSDELVVLVSPESLRSPWVMVEVGIAFALDLRLVGILLHVGANEVPSFLARYALRDLEEIDVYFKEVAARVHGEDAVVLETPAQEEDRPAEADAEAFAFSVGDCVLVLDRREHRAERADIGWVDEMEKYVGKAATVRGSASAGTRLELDADGGRWWWAPEWLAPFSGTAPEHSSLR